MFRNQKFFIRVFELGGHFNYLIIVNAGNARGSLGLFWTLLNQSHVRAIHGSVTFCPQYWEACFLDKSINIQNLLSLGVKKVVLE